MMGYFGVLTHRAVLCLLLFAGLSACGGGGGGAAPPGTPDPATPILESIIYIEVSPFFPASLAKGETRQFHATGYRVNGGSVDLTSTATWTSSASSVVSVNASGLATAAGVGSANVTASLGGASGYASQTVTAAEVLSMEITPGNPTSAAGVSTQFTATATFSDGSVSDLTSSLYWYTNDAAIASITSPGLVMSLSPGVTTVNAYWTPPLFGSSVTATTTLTVDKYSVAGTTSLLPVGSSIVLQNNGVDDMVVAADGSFRFAQPLAAAATYNVTVSSQLAAPAHPCTVVNGSGVISTYVTGVQVVCGVAVGTFAGGDAIFGVVDGMGTAARFNFPEDVATDSSGNVYVADTLNSVIRKITPAGVVTTLAGSGAEAFADGTGTAASFNRPYGIAVDSAGNVYVGDRNNNAIRKITPSGVVTTLAGNPPFMGSTDGTGTAARFSGPSGVALDAAGNLYVADQSNSVIRKVVLSTGTVSTLAGTAGSLGATNGTGAAASFYMPQDVAVDSAGNVFVADTYNNLIRKVTPAGVVTTFAGSGSTVFSDGTGTAASFASPTGIAVDAADNLYVADNAHKRIRKITPAGVVTTLAGSGVMWTTDGPAATAAFSTAAGIATGPSGEWYVADGGRIRKITP